MKNTNRFIWVGALIFCVVAVALLRNHKSLPEVIQIPGTVNESPVPPQTAYENEDKVPDQETEARAKARLVKSFEDVVPWLKKNAQQNDADSQFVLGQMYQEGGVFTQDLVEAYKWFSLAAQLGEKNAEKERDTLRAKLSEGQLQEATKRVSSFTPAASKI